MNPIDDDTLAERMEEIAAKMHDLSDRLAGIKPTVQTRTELDQECLQLSSELLPLAAEMARRYPTEHIIQQRHREMKMQYFLLKERIG